MKIYNPNGFNLPPIMIEKRKYRINIEEDQKVKNFINTKLLLNDNFNKLNSNLLEKSKTVLSYFNINDDLLSNPFYFSKKFFPSNTSDKTVQIFLRKLRPIT